MSKYRCCGRVSPESWRTLCLVRSNTLACHLWWKGYTADCWLPSGFSCYLVFLIQHCISIFLKFLIFNKPCLALCSFFAATILSCGWIIYLTYYNSRNIGLILTVIINRLYKDGYIHIGERVRTSVEWWWTRGWNSAKAFSSML